MKKTLVLVLSLLMVLSVASVASAELKIVGGQFSLQYDIDLGEKEPLDKSTFTGVKGEARINLEGKYSNDNFVGYAYSRFDFGKFEYGKGYQNVRWYMKKAEMDYIIADGFTIGLAYDEDDIKIHDEFIYSKKLKDFYKGVPLVSAKYAGDAVKVSNFNSAFAGGLFKNIVVAKVDAGDAKIRGLYNYNKVDKTEGSEKEKTNLFAEATYYIADWDLTVGGGVELTKDNTSSDPEKHLDYFNITGGTEFYLADLSVKALLTYRVSDEIKEENKGVKELKTILKYAGHELETVFVPESKIEPKLKLKKLAGTNNDIEIKATFKYKDDKYQAPAINVKHIFRF